MFLIRYASMNNRRSMIKSRWPLYSLCLNCTFKRLTDPENLYIGLCQILRHSTGNRNDFITIDTINQDGHHIISFLVEHKNE